MVLILKWTVSPWSTLMSVANPWMLGSPPPLTSHSLCGLPGFEFSQTIAFWIGGSQGAAWASSAPDPSAVDRKSPSAVSETAPSARATRGSALAAAERPDSPRSGAPESNLSTLHSHSCGHTAAEKPGFLPSQ